jgi:hypothetical protein
MTRVGSKDGMAMRQTLAVSVRQSVQHYAAWHIDGDAKINRP